MVNEGLIGANLHSKSLDMRLRSCFDRFESRGRVVTPRSRLWHSVDQVRRASLFRLSQYRNHVNRLVTICKLIPLIRHRIATERAVTLTVEGRPVQALQQGAVQRNAP